MKTLKEWAEAHGVTFVGRSAGVYTTGTVSAAVLEEIFAEADAMRRERDELAARLAEIERAEPVAWIERITGRLAAPTDEHRTRFPMVYRPLIDRPTPAQRVSAADEFPAAAPVQAEDLDADIIEAQRAVLQQLARRSACDWPGKCAHQRPAQAAAPERAEPAMYELRGTAGTTHPPTVTRASCVQSVYLVAAGLTQDGQELYTRHDAPVPMAENEKLYAAAQEHKA